MAEGTWIGHTAIIKSLEYNLKGMMTMTVSDALIKETEAKKADKKNWKNVIRVLKKEFPALRAELSADYFKSKPVAMQKIAAMDGVLSLPVIMSIIVDLQLKNESRLETLFLALTGKQMIKAEQGIEDGVKTGLDRVFKPVLDKDIGYIFEDLIYSKIDAITDLTEEAIHKKVDELIDKFYKATIVKLKVDAQRAEEAKKELIGLLRNEIFLACAYKVYLGADEKQLMYSKIEQGLFVAKYNADKLKKPFLALRHLARQVMVTQETNTLWIEYTAWLEGLYERINRMIGPENRDQEGKVKKDASGYYPRVDDEDNDLFNHVRGGITKYDLSLYHLDTVKVLQPMLLPVKLSPHDKSANAEEFKKPIVANFEGNAKDGSRRLVFFIPEGQDAALHNVIGKVAHATNQEVDVRMGTLEQNDMLVSRELDQFLKTRECKRLQDRIDEGGYRTREAEDELIELKIKKLEECVNQYRLTNAQRCALMCIGEKAPKACEEYKQQRKWTLLTGFTFWRACHAEEADRASMEIKIAKGDPKKVLNALFELRHKLKDDDSRNLIVKVNDLLVDAFHYLHSIALPQLQDEQRMTVRSGTG